MFGGEATFDLQVNTERQQGKAQPARVLLVAQAAVKKGPARRANQKVGPCVQIKGGMETDGSYDGDQRLSMSRESCRTEEKELMRDKRQQKCIDQNGDYVEK